MGLKINKININIYDRNEFPYELEVQKDNRENYMKLYFGDVVSLLFNIKTILEDNKVNEKEESDVESEDNKEETENADKKAELISKAKTVINNINDNPIITPPNNIIPAYPIISSDKPIQENIELKNGLGTIYFNHVNYNIQNWMTREAIKIYNTNKIDVIDVASDEQYLFGTVNDNEFDPTSNTGFMTRRGVVQFGPTANSRENLIKELNRRFDEYRKKYNKNSNSKNQEFDKKYDLNNSKISINDVDYKLIFMDKDVATVDALNKIAETFVNNENFIKRYKESIKSEDTMGGVIYTDESELAYNINFKRHEINIVKIKTNRK